MGRSGQNARTSTQQRRIPAEAAPRAVSKLMGETGGKIAPAEADRLLAATLDTPCYESVLYHGTNAGAAIRAAGFKAGAGGVIFATSFRSEAESYAAGGEVLPVHVRLRNPLIVEADESLIDVLGRYGLKPDPSAAGQREMARVLGEAGFDGLVKRFPEDNRDPSDRYPAREWARIFDPAALEPVEEVRVEGGDRTSFTLTPGLVDEMAVGAFTRGQCHALALAIHERTGWPILHVETVGDGELYVGHVCVETPDGRVLDITGCHDRAELLEGWHGDEYLRDADGSMTRHLPASGSWRTPRVDVAASYVDHVLGYVDGSRPNLCGASFEEANEHGAEDETPLETIELTDGDRQITVRRGVVDDNAREAFTRIQPHGFAAELMLKLQQRQEGWTACRIVGEGDWGEETLYWFVKTPDGKALDINGLHDPAELARAHGGTIEELGVWYRDLTRALDDEDDWSEPDTNAAAPFVRPLLDQCGYQR